MDVLIRHGSRPPVLICVLISPPGYLYAIVLAVATAAAPTRQITLAATLLPDFISILQEILSTSSPLQERQ